MRHSEFVSTFFAGVFLAACGAPNVNVEAECAKQPDYAACLRASDIPGLLGLGEQDGEESTDFAAYLNVGGTWDFASGTSLEIDPDGSVRGEPYGLHFDSASLDCVIENDPGIDLERFVVRANHRAEEAGFWLTPEGRLEVSDYEENLSGNATARIEGALFVSMPAGLRRMELRSLARESAYRRFNLDLLEEDRAEGSVVLEDLCDPSEPVPICLGTMAATFACDPRVVFLNARQDDPNSTGAP